MYPLAYICAAFFFGAFFAAALEFNTVFIILCVFFAAMLGLCAVKREKYIVVTAALCFVFAAFGAEYTYFYDYFKLKDINPLYGTEAVIQCHVIKTGRSVTVKSDYINGRRIRSGFMFTPYGDSVFETGDILTLKAAVYEPSLPAYYGDFNSNAYCKSKYIYGLLTVEDVKITGQKRDIYTFCEKMQNALTRNIDKTLSGDSAALLKALMTGDNDDFSGELKDTLSKSSLSHIAVVSGMHVSIIISMLGFCTGFLCRRKKLHLAVIAAILCLFACITGAQPSILRAVIMALIGLLAAGLKRRYDSMTALMLSAALLALINPYCTQNAGFQLSYAATFAIVLCVCAGKKRASYITLSVFLMLLPLCLYCYNFAALSVFFTNLLCMPLVAIAVPLGFAAQLIPALNYINKLILMLILTVARAFASLKALQFTAPAPSVTVICGMYLLTFAFFYVTAAKKKTVSAIAAMLGVILCFTGAYIQSASKITVFNDEANAVHIKTPHGKNIICTSDYKAAKGYIEKNCIKTVDVMVLTDFCENAEEIENTKILKLCMPKINGRRAQSAYPVKYYVYDKITIDKTSVIPLTYTPYRKTADKRRSVIEIDYRGKTIIFEPNGAGLEEISADIAVYANDLQTDEKINAKYTVKNGLQQGENMLYCMYDTDKCGAVTFKVRNGRITAETLR